MQAWPGCQTCSIYSSATVTQKSGNVCRAQCNCVFCQQLGGGKQQQTWSAAVSAKTHVEDSWAHYTYCCAVGEDKLTLSLWLVWREAHVETSLSHSFYELSDMSLTPYRKRSCASHGVRLHRVVCAWKPVFLVLLFCAPLLRKVRRAKKLLNWCPLCQATAKLVMN